MSALLQTLREFLRGLAAGLLRVAVLAFGALVALVTLACGLALAGGLLLWSLLRGRRALPPNVFVGRASRPQTPPPAEVVDVQVREVREVRDPTHPSQG
ncbi:MAG TPA: hypothetical protein PKO45_04405 [Rubrivivax sp.]|nr:hypothetical protein [Rubrivivax sp.]